MKQNPNSSADAVIAATAGGKLTWKKWAGRNNGNNGYKLGDISRGVKKKIKIWKVYNTLQHRQCLVCLSDDIKNKEDWFVTETCAHAVCLDCLLQYMKSQINDEEHHGALKCAHCPQTLTQADTVRAFKNDPTLIDIWDQKIRKDVLRALESFRPCPKCQGNTQSRLGGGFVTVECLEDVILRRKKDFTCSLVPIRIFINLVMTTIAIALCNKICLSQSRSTLCYEMITSWVFYRIYLFLNLWISHYERNVLNQVLKQPIDVKCPCCSDDFVLDTASEMKSNNLGVDVQSEKWIRKNTRPCPSCRAPVNKNGGCNHMTCTRCKAKFCWACMRLDISCRVFQCNNGAPFGNASGEANQYSGEQSQLQIETRFNASEMIDYQRNREFAKRIRKFDICVLSLCMMVRYFGVFQILHLVCVPSTTTLLKHSL